MFVSLKFTAEPRLLLGIARIHDMLNDPDKAIGFYKRVLILDASNVESIACLGAHYFYADQVKITVSFVFIPLLVPLSVMLVDAHLLISHIIFSLETFQPEMSIRYYRRLLQMGVNNTELWNNIGLCCFYSSQYDMSLNCFDRALSMASDDDMADVW